MLEVCADPYITIICISIISDEIRQNKSMAQKNVFQGGPRK